MKLLICIFSVFWLVSCNYSDKKKKTTESILEEELKSFSWNEVDKYPSFDNCDSLTTKFSKKRCFVNTIRNFVGHNFSKHNIVVSKSFRDTITLSATITKEATININHILVKEETRQHIPKIDSLLQYSFDSLPKVYPAIKRGQLVTMRFELPIIIQVH